MALPRETITSTLILVGIGFAIVIAMLFFAFTMLNSERGLVGGNNNSGIEEYPSPTSEYMPNQPTELPESSDNEANNGEDLPAFGF